MFKPPHQFNFHLLPKITTVTSSGSTHHLSAPTCKSQNPQAKEHLTTADILK
jgi:hypothetical protein